jgi:Xaa-Pro aminopeptidase
MKSIIKYPLVLIFILFGVSSFRLSNDAPQDYLSAAFHQERREQLRKLLPPNSVAVFFANAVRNRANDVEYVYHQDPDFYYLTGYQEPHAMLVVFSEEQKNAKEKYIRTCCMCNPKMRCAKCGLAGEWVWKV